MNSRTETPIRRAPPPAWLYGLVVFAAAWLVFWIQPLSVRGVLPVLGGSPAVWNTAMVFFQGALLAGYALAHVLVRRASPAGQLAVLAVLWIGIALSAPVGGLRLFGEIPVDLPPALWLLGTLAGALGVSFVAASCLTPLVQAWLARAGAGAVSADPYFLYSASNAGSAGALLVYPFLLEPFLGLGSQAWIWSVALLALTPLLLVLWHTSSRNRDAAPGHNTSSAATSLPVVRVLALSAAPSALLLAITRYLTTDIAAVPLLWILPLVLYLATFVHAFARRQWIAEGILARLAAPGLIVLAVSSAFARTVFAFGIVHLLVFVLIALYCHRALARLRPPAADLTRFYLLVSSGGLIGGLLVALIAPMVFSDVYEYPIALALAAALLPSASRGVGRGHLIAAAIALAVVLCGLSATQAGFDTLTAIPTIVFVGVLALFAPSILFLRARPALFAAAILSVFLVPGAVSRGVDEEVARERTFYGVYRIVESGGMREFYHGTTLHGAEWRRKDGTIESRTTYYGLETPYAEVLAALVRRPEPLTIGLAGLGTGSLACYARPRDEVRVYEIDPSVVALARTHFAALRECAPEARISIGDARLILEREEVSLDLLALDTFSSDSIPVHLLTLEAFRSYLRVLAPVGVLAVHISNRYLDLEPVLAALADRTGLVARIKRYSAPEDGPQPQLSKSSHVIVMTRNESTLRALDLDGGWSTLGPPDRVRVWTDDYTSIVPLLRWW